MNEFINNILWVSIVQIIAIDIILGVDNAIVIAMACNNLPENKRRLGIFYGTAGAIILRIILVFFATSLMLVPGLKIIGGALLVWIGVKLIKDSSIEKSHTTRSQGSLLAAIKTIIIADFVMSLDNSIAIAAAANGNLYVVVFGVLLSIPIIVFGSSIFLKYLNKYPFIIVLGGFLLGWIGGDLIQRDIYIVNNSLIPQTVHHYLIPVIFGIITIILSFAFTNKKA